MRCAHCGGKIIKDEDGLKCLNCARRPNEQTVASMEKFRCGHPKTPENTTELQDLGVGVCRTCRSERARHASIERNTEKGPGIDLRTQDVEEWKRLAR